MNDSFKLLSSMSPKTNKNQKTLEKAIRVLALKKNLRRSSLNGKVSTKSNEDLALIDSSVDSSANRNNSKVDSVVIIESSSDTEQDDKEELSHQKDTFKDVRIQEWLDNIENDGSDNLTLFSQVSSIYGGTKFNDNGCATHSTFVDTATRRFDELFNRNETEIDKGPNEDCLDATYSSLEYKNKKSLKTRLQQSTKKQFKTPNRSSDKSTKKPDDKFTLSCEETEVFLDKLYGTQWRDTKHEVITQSEPRKKHTHQDWVPTSENRNMKASSGSTQKDSHFNKVKFEQLEKSVKSPWYKRFQGICDSDTDSDDPDRDKIKSKLDFKSSNSDDSDSCTPNQKTSCLGGKKIRGAMVPPQTATSSKKGVKNKSNINRKKLDNKENLKPDLDEVVSISSGDCEEGSVSSDDEFDKEVTRIVEDRRQSVKPISTRICSFLESLSGSVPLSKCDVTARLFRTSYSHHRDQLVKKLFNLYNEKVFGNVIPMDTPIEWNDKLRGTAGLCHCRRITHRSGTVERTVKISLATKVLDSADRLRDTLIHEMCHAATWIVDMVSNGHGLYWKKWALHAMKTFPELPPIKRCHSYVINTKYTYKCTGCGYSIGRHSKSLNIERKRCGYCLGKFEVLINKTTKNGETKTVPVTPKKEPSKFALFVKENYALYKEPSRKHGDVMKILGQKFTELKVQTT